MILLGKNTDDKGSQFETLIHKLLYGQNYQNLTLNRIGPGGHEIDVSGEYVGQYRKNNHPKIELGRAEIRTKYFSKPGRRSKRFSNSPIAFWVNLTPVW